MHCCGHNNGKCGPYEGNCNHDDDCLNGLVCDSCRDKRFHKLPEFPTTSINCCEPGIYATTIC